MSWFKTILRVKNSKEIPHLTDYLVKNKTFRKFAVNSNHSGKSVFSRIDGYLQRELLREDIPKERWLGKDKKK